MRSWTSMTKDRHERGRLVETAAPDADAATGHDRNVLLAPDAIGHRRSRDRRAEAQAPYFLQRGGIVGGELAGHMPGEQQTAIGAQHARLGRRLERLLADDLSGLQIERPKRTMRRDPALLGAAWRQTDIVLLLVHRGLAGGARDAALGARHIGNAALGIQGRREEG